MTPSYQQIGNQHFLYDPDIVKKITPAHFDPSAWRQGQKVTGEAKGRGNVLFVSEPPHTFVLRHYKRGGIISEIVTDHYLWLGLSRTRAWQEWQLLHWMFKNGLPVPQPVAASVKKSGYAYTADLLTMALPDCQSMAGLQKANTLNKRVLSAIGKTIRQFHDHQIFHADLNAHNILIREKTKVHLIDFDQGCRKKGEAWKASNLARLYRSLSKLEKAIRGTAFPSEQWEHLNNGYHKISVRGVDKPSGNYGGVKD